MGTYSSNRIHDTSHCGDDIRLIFPALGPRKAVVVAVAFDTRHLNVFIIAHQTASALLFDFVKSQNFGIMLHRHHANRLLNRCIVKQRKEASGVLCLVAVVAVFDIR